MGWGPSAKVHHGDNSRIEAPVTLRGYLLCVFAAFGGILFGYDSGYINGVTGMNFFKQQFGSQIGGKDAYNGFNYTAAQQGLIVSILSAGTFFGALFAGYLADLIGRRTTVIAGCGVFSVGVAMQVASTTIGLLVGGRLIAGIGVGFVSATIILYMSEVAPKAVRGAIVSGYQFFITIGLLLASVVGQCMKDNMTSASYRIPMGIQFLWALILAGGLACLPESPRYYIKKDRHDAAVRALATLRGQPQDSTYIQDELRELIANYEFERNAMKSTWADCFTGGWSPTGNFRRVVLGVTMQMMQQWTGVNFIFYFGTPFFQSVGMTNAFVVGMITTAVNVASTPISFWTIEKLGRRTLLIWGAIGMCACEFIIAITGTAAPNSPAAIYVMITFICIYIFFFASTWGPAAWVYIGEIFPLPIRAKGVAFSTASNWFWNCIIAQITPYLVKPEKANLGPKVFWLWGSTCALCVAYSYFLISETKGLSLEQVDQMLAETRPSNSAKWVPHETFAEREGKNATHNEKLSGLGVEHHDSV